MQIITARLILVAHTIFIGAIFGAFLIAMLFSDGRASINSQGEGWLETFIAGILFLIGLKLII